MILEMLCTDILNYQIRYLKFTNTIIFSPEVAELMDMGSPIHNVAKKCYIMIVHIYIDYILYMNIKILFFF